VAGASGGGVASWSRSARHGGKQCQREGTAARLVSEDLVIPVVGILVGRDQKTQNILIISNSNGYHLNPSPAKSVKLKSD
jgi:hypothetical protein